ncbi:hypothetical protein BVG16_28710 [Paenibacillus selenitireducens]|uniref:ABC transporter substrate-binding protein n=1 Tax=Paenibacillus selenitireducens TaxID=1324314 RepID=A0A1T2X0M7_9BACL|nr:extracellular solute-binding protein [Paenibacillus selenitireducens]OPA73448.1 hypothetical protein BVG16_28710 [Paenibacillus selenitireducens]
MNMKQKGKSVLILSCLLLTLGGIVGCSKPDNSPKEPTVSPSASKVKIEIWNSARHDQATREALIKQFNETNKDNIEIEYKVFTDNYPDQLRLAFNANKLPDLMFEPPQELYAAGSILNINDMITEETKKRFVEPAFYKPSFAKKDEFYQIRENVTNYKLVYNKDLFEASGLDPEKPPATWQEMRDYAKTITEKGDGKKYGLGLPIKQTVFWQYYALIPSARSGDYWGGGGWDAKAGKFDYTRYSKYIQWWHDVNKEGSVFPGVGSYDNDMIRAQFSEGNVGMLSAATWDIGVFNDQFPAKINWGVADFPTWDGEVKGSSPYNTGNGITINKNTKHLKETKIVWEFFTSDDMYTELAKAGLGSFTNIAAQDKSLPPQERKGLADFIITQPAKQYIAAPSVDYKLLNPPPKIGDIDFGGGYGVWEVFTDAFTKGGEDIDKLMQELSEVQNKFFEESVKAGSVDLDLVKVPDFNPMTN